MPRKATFTAGRNIAMKVPPHLYEATIGFYRDVLGLTEITRHAPSVGFEFGSNNLWIDRVVSLSQAEVWLEVVTDDIEAASRDLAAAGVVRCDQIEPLDSFQPTRFNLLANSRVSRQAHDSSTPDLRGLAAPVLMVLGECSDIPRGRAIKYFDVYRIARSHVIPGVGHITWGNAKGQSLTREAIGRFVDNLPGNLPDEPTHSTLSGFVESGR